MADDISNVYSSPERVNPHQCRGKFREDTGVREAKGSGRTCLVPHNISSFSLLNHSGKIKVNCFCFKEPQNKDFFFVLWLSVVELTIHLVVHFARKDDDF